MTAAALFDLVSASWIGSLARDIAAAGAAFYTALTYNGADGLSPPHPADAAMLAGFHAHQRRDKGFGPAAGPRATARVATVPLPPDARFSTTTCWPSAALILSATARARMSLVPPGGSGTTSVIGLFG